MAHLVEYGAEVVGVEPVLADGVVCAFDVTSGGGATEHTHGIGSTLLSNPRCALGRSSTRCCCTAHAPPGRRRPARSARQRRPPDATLAGALPRQK